MSSLITVMVSPQGETRVITTGFAGGQCLLATWELERALGQRQHERMTSEFFDVAVQAAPASAAEAFCPPHES